MQRLFAFFRPLVFAIFRINVISEILEELTDGGSRCRPEDHAAGHDSTKKRRHYATWSETENCRWKSEIETANTEEGHEKSGAAIWGTGRDTHEINRWGNRENTTKLLTMRVKSSTGSH